MSAPKATSLRLQQLEQQRENIRARERQLAKQMLLERNKLAGKERKLDTRRKILDGALIQKEAASNPEIYALLAQLRESELTRDDDRRLFGMAPIAKSAQGD